MKMYREEYCNSKTAVILQTVRNSLFVLTLTDGKKKERGKRKRHERWEEQGRWREKNILNYLFLNILNKGSFLKTCAVTSGLVPCQLNEQYSSDCVCS